MPNVILITTDQQRYDTLAAMGILLYIPRIWMNSRHREPGLKGHTAPIPCVRPPGCPS